MGNYVLFNQLQDQLRGWVAQGISRVKMKVGRNPGEDLERVRLARQAIGPAARLFVDGNGAFTRKQALWFADQFAAEDVSWFEEPVPSRSQRKPSYGLRRIADERFTLEVPLSERLSETK
ncbi:MAG: hypothetical protein HYX72_10565 [Acidobacteria bacterium]|nr:hypothetical protein [Acidobacteriota bacterium]